MKKNTSSSLFLMELIIAILFFSISSAICIQVFLKARYINNEGLEKTHAAMLASNIAEVYKSEQLEQYYQIDSNGYTYFNKDFITCDSSSYVYKALLKENDNVLSITILYEDKEIYSLKCKHYKQRIFDRDVI